MSGPDGTQAPPIGAPDYYEAEQFSLPVIIEETERHLPDVAGGTFSGKIVERDQELVAAVLGAHVAGVGKKRIGEAFKISPNTVRGIVDRARQAGKIDPYKRRVSNQLGRAIESGMEQWIDAAEAGEIRADQIPVAVGIFSDKKALIDGEATSRVERTSGPSMDEVLEKMKRAKVALGDPLELPAGEVVAIQAPEGEGDRPGPVVVRQSTDNSPETLQKGSADGAWCGSGADRAGPEGLEGVVGGDLEGVAGKGRGGGSSVRGASRDDGSGGD